MDSLDIANLKLLDRPDLGITFTKVKCASLIRGRFRFYTFSVIFYVKELMSRKGTVVI